MRGKKLKDQSPWLYGKIVFYIVCALILLFLILPIFVVISPFIYRGPILDFPSVGVSFALVARVLLEREVDIRYGHQSQGGDCGYDYIHRARHWCVFHSGAR